MDRPLPLELADVIRAASERLLERHPAWFNWLHLKVLRAILRCRTIALGGHADECSRCGHQALSLNSCRNRHCPRCLCLARERWLNARRAELLPLALRARFLLFRMNRHHWLCKTSASSTICYSSAAPRRCSQSPVIGGILAPKSASSAFSIRGIKRSSSSTHSLCRCCGWLIVRS